MAWHPSANRVALKARAELYAYIRQFFTRHYALEVETPLLGLSALAEESQQVLMAGDFYLQPVALPYLLRLAAAGSGDVYQISKVFGRIRQSEHRQMESTLLEWCRQEADQWALMEETADLFERLLGCHHVEHKTCLSVFEEYLGFDPHRATLAQLKFEARQHLKVEMPRGSRNDWFELLMEYLVEPLLGQTVPVFVYDYPATDLLATRTMNEQGREVAERFQVFYRGKNVATGFSIQTDAEILKTRLQASNVNRKKKGLRALPLDGDLLQAFDHGLQSCGYVAVNLDILLMLQLKVSQQQDVVSFLVPI